MVALEGFNFLQKIQQNQQTSNSQQVDKQQNGKSTSIFEEATKNAQNSQAAGNQQNATNPIQNNQAVKAGQKVENGFGGIDAKNAFGADLQGFTSGMDTLELSSGAKTQSQAQKTDNAGQGGVAQQGLLSGSQGFSVANNDSEIAELAEKLGMNPEEATEDEVKAEIQGLSKDELLKLAQQDSEAVDMAEDLGLITKNEVQEKVGKSEDSNNEPSEEDKNPFKKLDFGSFGAEV